MPGSNCSIRFVTLTGTKHGTAFVAWSHGKTCHCLDDNGCWWWYAMRKTIRCQVAIFHALEPCKRIQMKANGSTWIAMIAQMHDIGPSQTLILPLLPLALLIPTSLFLTLLCLLLNRYYYYCYGVTTLDYYCSNAHYYHYCYCYCYFYCCYW